MTYKQWSDYNTRQMHRAEQQMSVMLTHEPIKRAPDPSWRKALWLGLHHQWHTLVVLLVLVLAGSVHAEPYAILMGGGPNKDMAYADFSLSMGDVYGSLMSAGYDPGNVWVLDGNGPTNTRAFYQDGRLPVIGDITDANMLFARPYPDGTHYYTWWRIASADDYTGDGIVDVDAANDRAGLALAVADLSARMTGDDSLLIYMVSHGGLRPGGYIFGLYDDDPLYGYELAESLSAIPYSTRTVLNYTCNSGAIAPYLTGPGQRTIALTSTTAADYSWTTVVALYRDAPWTERWDRGSINTWSDALTDGLTAADANGDYSISWAEIHQYTLTHDDFANPPVSRVMLDGVVVPYTDAVEYPMLYDPEGLADSTYWRLAGDANWDGAVDVSDLSIFAGHYRQTGQGWRDGDFNGDGAVDVSDLAILAGEYRVPCEAEPIPEPMPGWLIASGFVGYRLFFRRRSR